MRFGQNQTSPNYQALLQQIMEGQQRLAYVETQMQANKRFMLVLILLALIVLILNKGCGKNERKIK